MSKQIIEVLDSLGDKFGLAIDWTTENVVPYLEQLCNKYVKYEIVTSVIYMVIGVICLFLGKYLIKITKYCYKKYCYKKANDDYSCGGTDWEVFCILAAIGTATAFILGIAVIIQQIFDIATCLTFPEKFIIDELMSIYNK